MKDALEPKNDPKSKKSKGRKAKKSKAKSLGKNDETSSAASAPSEENLPETLRKSPDIPTQSHLESLKDGRTQEAPIDSRFDSNEPPVDKNDSRLSHPNVDNQEEKDGTDQNLISRVSPTSPVDLAGTDYLHESESFSDDMDVSEPSVIEVTPGISTPRHTEEESSDIEEEAKTSPLLPSSNDLESPEHPIGLNSKDDDIEKQGPEDAPTNKSLADGVAKELIKEKSPEPIAEISEAHFKDQLDSTDLVSASEFLLEKAQIRLNGLIIMSK